MVENLAMGFVVAFTPDNLLFCLIGVLVGTAIGVLPGIGPVPTIALLLPLTFGLPPETAMIMLAGIYYGAQYGGSTTAILINMPGEISSVVTTLDGYRMAQAGRAGQALTVAAIGSFVAGTAATLIVALLSPVLIGVALAFGPADYFALMALGLIVSAVLAQGSLLKAVGMITLGVALGLVGTDVNSGQQRFTFGIPDLSDGIGFVPLAMGLFGIAEILRNLEKPEERGAVAGALGSMALSREDWKRATPAMGRGTLLGSLLGVLPGGGAALASFGAYSLERKLSRRPHEFGHGAIEGVAGPEAANNAAAQTSFIPLLTLGIPANSVMALMIGALVMQGIQPGPRMIESQPTLFWGLIASMWIGNLMLVVINLPLIGLWIRMLSVPYRVLYPTIVLFGCLGVYCINLSLFDVALTLAFGVIGLLFMKFRLEPAPLLIGFILGPMMEEYLRRALLQARGDPMTFLQNPISATLLALSLIVLATMALPTLRRGKATALANS